MVNDCPVGMVEYQYDPNGPWRLAKISLEPLEAYKASKFTLWRGMLEKPSCLSNLPPLSTISISSDPNR